MKAKVEIEFVSATENYGLFKDAVSDFLKALEAKTLTAGDKMEIKIHTGEEKVLLMEETD